MRKQVKSKKVKGKILILTFAFLLLPFAFAYAHPGATDKNGCHKVTQDYKYPGTKKVLKAGTTHCHAGLGQMKLGSTVLENPKQPGTTEKPQKTKKSKK